MAWRAVEERAGGEIGGVVPRTENDPVSDTFNLLGRRAALVETTVERRRGVCVCESVCMPPRLLPLGRYQAVGLLRVEIGPKRLLIVSNFISGRRFQSTHLPSSIDLPDCPYRRQHLHICQTRGNGTLKLCAKTPDMTSTCKLHGPRVLPCNRSMRCAGPGAREPRPSCFRHPRSKGEPVASSQVMFSECVLCV